MVALSLFELTGGGESLGAMPSPQQDTPQEAEERACTLGAEMGLPVQQAAHLGGGTVLPGPGDGLCTYPAMRHCHNAQMRQASSIPNTQPHVMGQ